MNKRSLLHLLRILPLAAAALASVATSMIPKTLTITSATPPPDESGASPDVVPTLRLSVSADGEGDVPTGIEVRDSRNALVVGHSERSEENGELVFRYVHAEPLAPETYFITFVGSSNVDVTFADEGLAALFSFPGADSAPVMKFSIASEPRLRYAIHDRATGVFTVSFTEDMDVSTLEHVKVAGEQPQVTRTYRGGDLHVLEVAAPLGAVNLVLEPGLAARTGVPVMGLPVTIGPIQR